FSTAALPGTRNEQPYKMFYKRPRVGTRRAQSLTKGGAVAAPDIEELSAKQLRISRQIAKAHPFHYHT
ncbi:hypothetical protein CRM22_006234, partial [Opisthorchis felineus]